MEMKRNRRNPTTILNNQNESQMSTSDGRK